MTMTMMVSPIWWWQRRHIRQTPMQWCLGLGGKPRQGGRTLQRVHWSLTGRGGGDGENPVGVDDKLRWHDGDHHEKMLDFVGSLHLKCSLSLTCWFPWPWLSFASWKCSFWDMKINYFQGRGSTFLSWKCSISYPEMIANDESCSYDGASQLVPLISMLCSKLFQHLVI